ncbi:hypothetical protein NKG94_00720 [Micromonospora sp. M12]
MPITRIAIREGKSDAYKQALLGQIYKAMRETVKIKDGDRFMAITEHGESAFAHGDFSVSSGRLTWCRSKFSGHRARPLTPSWRCIARSSNGSAATRGASRGCADLGRRDRRGELVFRERGSPTLQGQ